MDVSKHNSSAYKVDQNKFGNEWDRIYKKNMPEETQDDKVANGLLPEPIHYVTTEEELKLPTQGLIVVEQKPEDFVRGGSPLPQVILRPDGQHDAYLPVQEIQRLGPNAEGPDTFMCTEYAKNNCLEVLHKEQFGYEINNDDLFGGVGSGNIPYQGNSVAKNAEWTRKNGFIKEKGRVKTYTTIEQAYTPLTDEERAEGLKSLETYEIGYEWLDRPYNSQSATPEEVMDALKYGPLACSVDGTAYRFNQSGYIGEFKQYTHEIMVFGYEKGKFWKIFDSETEQALKFAWDYPLGFPMRFTLKKKNMKIYRKNGQPAIGFLNLEDGGIYLWADGVIAGGSLFKTLGFTYALAEVVDEWPAEIKGYITTTGLQWGIEE